MGDVIFLEPIKFKKKYENIILNKLIDFFKNNIYQGLFDILAIKKIYNSTDPLIDGINAGKIRYYDGFFISKTGFTAKQTRQLLELGAVYYKKKQGYKLSLEKVPFHVQQAITELNILEVKKYKLIQDYINELQENIKYAIDDLVFDEEIINITDELDNDFKKSVKKINVIPVDLTPELKLNIAKQYTDNMNFFIKSVETKKIPQMREEIKQFVFDGYRNDKIEEWILKNYNSDKKKASFLARNETNILISKYNEYRYTQIGVNKYKWVTRHDSKVRDWHKELDGQVFDFRYPPIIDNRTGERGNPKQTYNCRCEAKPLIDKDFWQK